MTKITIDKALLKQAIDTLGYYASVCGEDDQDTPAKQAQTALRAALAEPAMEPVAWMTFDGEGGYDLRLYDMNESYRNDYIKRNGEKYASWVQPLYASPPPPVEVPMLSYEEILNVMRDGNNCNYNDEAEHIDFARSIEAALRQKAGL